MSEGPQTSLEAIGGGKSEGRAPVRGCARNKVSEGREGLHRQDDGGPLKPDLPDGGEHWALCSMGPALRQQIGQPGKGDFHWQIARLMRDPATGAGRNS